MTASADYQYVGSELELFKKARNWKRYYGEKLRPYIRGSVLEVGAGIGGTTEILLNEKVSRWVCLEPDSALADQLEKNLSRMGLACCRAVRGTLVNLDPGERFDCILYVDVLEHIQKDREELNSASRHLKEGGALAVLAPAHSILFSEFDRAIGHFRRYDRASLAAAAPRELNPQTFLYLDCLGFFLSLANRLFLRRSRPSSSQIEFWDRWVIPLSRRADPILGYRFGKSLLGVWSVDDPLLVQERKAVQGGHELGGAAAV